ncbi:MAG: toxin-antitoxin system YwqK family antitoxin [Bacteroidota bacterium]
MVRTLIIHWGSLLGLVLGTAAGGFAQDTIFLYGDTIRVGELEWDMEKDWRARGELLSKNTELYGEHVRIYLAYHPNKMTEQIVFGYRDSLGDFVAHGPARYFYPSGQLLGKRYFVKGVMEGSAEDYYKNTRLKVRSHFRRDTLDGFYESFYENGSREQRAFYRMGRPEGSYYAWFANGQRKWIEWYHQGRKNGADSSYYENGRLQSVYHYREDARHGLAEHFHRNGRPWTGRVYEEDLLLEIRYLKNKDGRPLEVGTFTEGNGWLNVYNGDGILVERVKYRRGRLRKTKSVKR